MPNEVPTRPPIHAKFCGLAWSPPSRTKPGSVLAVFDSMDGVGRFETAREYMDLDSGRFKRDPQDIATAKREMDRVEEAIRNGTMSPSDLPLPSELKCAPVSHNKAISPKPSLARTNTVRSPPV